MHSDITSFYTLIVFASFSLGLVKLQHEAQRLIDFRTLAIVHGDNTQGLCDVKKAREGYKMVGCVISWEAHGASGWENVCQNSLLKKRGSRQERLKLICPPILKILGGLNYQLTWMHR